MMQQGQDSTDGAIMLASVNSELPAHKPAMSIAEAKLFFTAVEEAVKELIPRENCVPFKDNKGKTHYAIRKADLEKVALYFGVGTMCKPPILVEHQDGSYSYQVIALAYRGSRAVTDIASCSSKEKDFMKDNKNGGARQEHDVLTMATTRAQGRALRKFFAIAEPTAEELGDNHEEKPKTTTAKFVNEGLPCTCTMGTNTWDMSKTPNQCLVCGGFRPNKGVV